MSLFNVPSNINLHSGGYLFCDTVYTLVQPETCGTFSTCSFYFWYVSYVFVLFLIRFLRVRSIFDLLITLCRVQVGLALKLPCDMVLSGYSCASIHVNNGDVSNRKKHKLEL